jgi:hypothetical protein
MRFLLSSGLAALVLAGGSAAMSQSQSNPPVKLSESGICHPRGGEYYSRTKKFRPFDSMEACVKAGGRPARR